LDGKAKIVETKEAIQGGVAACRVQGGEDIEECMAEKRLEKGCRKARRKARRKAMRKERREASLGYVRVRREE
jgi:hypothetical protein